MRPYSMGALVILSVLGGLACQPPAPPASTAAGHDAASFFATTSFLGASFSADEARLLLTSDASGVFNAYSVPSVGGDPQQLTHSVEDAIRTLSWFPGDDRFLYTADRGGNERHHIFVQDPGGQVTDLTPGDEVKASFLGWSGDKSHFWLLTNERQPAYFDLYRYGVESYDRELVFRNDDGWTVGGVSRDGRWVALRTVSSNTDSDLYLFSVEARTLTHLTPHEGEVNFGFVTFTPDSRELYYSTDGKGEFNQVWSHRIEGGEKRLILEAEWDVTFVSFSEGGRYRVSGINADARTEVTILDTVAGEELRLPELPSGTIQGVTFSPSETQVALYVSSDTSPANLFSFAIGEPEARQLTQSLSPGISEDELVEAEIVRYPSFDGLEIPALLYRPHGASAERPAPAMLWVHGGPGGQSRKGYRPSIQHLVNHGIAILAVNNRGSSGYGKTFFHLDDRRHGDVDLKDCVWARRYLEGLEWVDDTKIGIMGGSYGGYMVAAALAFEPEVFEVGVDIFGVTNWVRTLKSIPAWWAPNRRSLFAELGDPSTDEERLRRISPLFHADQIVRPLLVVQGANDPRVLQVESDELVEAVRANGVPVEYLVFPDEGHGFASKANRVSASEAYLTFLNRHLRSPSS